jgi:O-antigen/teichoic acid export membrane protein
MYSPMSTTSILKRLQGQGIGAFLARGASGSLFVKILGASMAFGTNVLLARLMGTAQYGIYVYALAWVNVLALLCQFGMNTTLLRYVSSYNAKGEWGLLRGLITRSVQYVFSISMLIGVLSVITIFFLEKTIGKEQAITFWLAFLLLPFLSLNGLRSESLLAFKRVIKAALPDSLIRPLAISILSIVMWVAIQKNLSASQVMLFNVAAAVLAFTVGTIWLRRALPPQFHTISPAYSEREWMKVSIPLLLVNGMHLVLNQTDVLMIGIFVGTKQAGIYSVASSIAGLAAFGAASVNTIVAPTISEYHSTQRHKELQRLMALAARGIFSFTIVTILCLSLLGKHVLSVFGGEFVSGVVPMGVLLVGYAVKAFAGSGGYVMTMTGHQNQYAVLIVAVALSNIIFNAILIPAMGATGAAIATTISISIWEFIVLIYVKVKLNIDPTVLAKG